MNDLSDIPQDLLTRSVAGRRLDKKCIILTGAAGSIGSFITRQLLREGARVMLTGRDQSKLDGFIEDLVDEGFEHGTMVSATGDCADPAVCRDIVAKTVDAFGAVDILVNNAGYGLVGEFEKYSFHDENFILFFPFFLQLKQHKYFIYTVIIFIRLLYLYTIYSRLVYFSCMVYFFLYGLYFTSVTLPNITS